MGTVLGAKAECNFPPRRALHHSNNVLILFTTKNPTVRPHPVGGREDVARAPTTLANCTPDSSVVDESECRLHLSASGLDGSRPRSGSRRQSEADHPPAAGGCVPKISEDSGSRA